MGNLSFNQVIDWKLCLQKKGERRCKKFCLISGLQMLFFNRCIIRGQNSILKRSQSLTNSLTRIGENDSDIQNFTEKNTYAAIVFITWSLTNYKLSHGLLPTNNSNQMFQSIVYFCQHWKSHMLCDVLLPMWTHGDYL